MESFFGRYKNPLVLMAVLFIQVIGLATQVKRPSDPKTPNSPGTRLIRVWAVTAFTPVERAFVGTGRFVRNIWHNWIDLHGVRKQNQDLQAEISRLRMEQTRLREDAEQGHRLQTLLGFREKFISETVAAQVIGTSGSEKSHVIYIDKGSRDGLHTDMAVITPDGIVGKVKDVFPLSAQVLMISDRDSGAGVILEKSRLQGVLKGTHLGEIQVDGVLADEKIEVGEKVIASGGDRIYPKGFPVGTVTSAVPDRDSGAFLIIKVKPAADLNRLEEVLVVTKMSDQSSVVAGNEGHVRAADILAQRLPSVPKTEPQPGTSIPLDGGKKKAVATPELKKPGTNSTPGGTTAPAKAKSKKIEAQPGQATTEKITPNESEQAQPADKPKVEKPQDLPKPPNATENPPQ
ncbi:MAG TPA: rod shape-determining protein MreC [Candidatus Angelobacter sp.]